MARPKITLDRSPNLVLVLCSDCPAWREAAVNEPQAWRLAQIHATFVHRDDTLAASFRGRAFRACRSQEM